MMISAERIGKLRRYHNAKYFQGKMMRYLIEDSAHTSVYCDRCGNIANGVISVERKQGEFNFPLCAKHFREIFPEVTQFPCMISYDYLKLKPIT